MPISSSTLTASGFTREGADPAEETFTPAGASARAMPSAIWLRAELATQRKRTCRGLAARSFSASASHPSAAAAALTGAPPPARRRPAR
jgi:hypothetical protein